MSGIVVEAHGAPLAFLSDIVDGKTVGRWLEEAIREKLGRGDVRAMDSSTETAEP